MGKNNKLINQMRLIAAANRAEAIDKASDEMVPVIYAAMALALHKTYGFGFERIDRVFLESQKVWEEFVGRPDEMIQLCENETGITVTFKGKQV